MAERKRRGHAVVRKRPQPSTKPKPLPPRKPNLSLADMVLLRDALIDYKVLSLAPAKEDHVVRLMGTLSTAIADAERTGE